MFNILAIDGRAHKRPSLFWTEMWDVISDKERHCMEWIVAIRREVRRIPAWCSQSFPKWRYIYQLLTEEAMSTVHPATVMNSQSWSSIKRVNQIGRTSYEEADVRTYCNGLLCSMWRWLVEHRDGRREAISDVFCHGHCKYPGFEENFWMQEIKALAFLLC